MITMFAVQDATGQINCAFTEPETAQEFIDHNIETGVWEDSNQWDTAPIALYSSLQDWEDNNS